MIEREEDLKQESRGDDHNGNKMASTTASWSRFKDPRVVRVSRAFGGKDRHSKVCTVRGLRDRRVRLSVPTAIQLYDLQDRLGLNQPSKVVDWLLNAAKQEIEGLPPLQFPILTPNHGFIMPAKQGLKISGDFSWNDPSKPRVFSEDDQQNPSSSLLSSSTMAPFNSWDPSNLTLSHHQDLDNFALGHLAYQPYLPFATNAGFDLKQPGSEFSDSSAQPVVRPFRFSLTADLLPPASHNKHHHLNSSS